MTLRGRLSTAAAAAAIPSVVPERDQCRSDSAGCDRPPTPSTQLQPPSPSRRAFVVVPSRREQPCAVVVAITAEFDARPPSQSARCDRIADSAGRPRRTFRRTANTEAIIYCWLSSSSPTGRHNYAPPALGGKRGTFPSVAMQEVERARNRNMAKKQNSKVERQKSSDKSSEKTSEKSSEKTLSKAPSIDTKKHEK
ncbi:Hypothetical protein CINCED_3A003381 [Cinara cedri]|uniref:Uncharacterized protein n=1 Tax=Cinara cedri TaxID=506608 RepID=A0A5E4NIV6_9HEMI|nr:Hypothetical protein CINCED_3A003381 [Cinara cedri]